MKYFLLYCFTGGFAIAGVVDCKRRSTQNPVKGSSWNLSDMARNTVAPSPLSTSAALTTSSTTTILSAITPPSSISIIQPPPFISTEPIQPIPPPHSSDYLPIFFDDFTGTPGTLPSTTNWLFDTGTSYPSGPHNWGNNESEVYTTSPFNIALTSSSTLLITPLFTLNQWTSARIETVRSDFGCAPNSKLFIQAKIRLGNDPMLLQEGIWPAFWALGNSYRGNSSNWPQATEWDIMESINGSPVNMMTIHCGTYPYGPCNERTGITDSVSMARGVWNIVGFEVDRTNENWEQQAITWFLNGEKRFQVLGSRVGSEGDWEDLAEEGHFLLLNIAVGGTVGKPGVEVIGGSGTGMEIDYVGVWVT